MIWFLLLCQAAVVVLAAVYPVFCLIFLALLLGDALGWWRFMSWSKDGGPDSNVDGFWFIELKGLFSVALLRFNPGMREVFHTHAFNSISWLFTGHLIEEHRSRQQAGHTPSIRPIVTRRTTFHRVLAVRKTWALTFRGPWAPDWTEYNNQTKTLTILTNHREVVASWTYP